jgi:molybdopterin-guanine dinucleotide biosynthesis protein A
MKRHEGVAVFILAGGMSSRMGRDKGSLEISDVPLIVRTATLAERVVAKITIVGDVQKYQALGIPVIPDREFGPRSRTEISAGPLGGIATALSATVYPWNLVLACDLPYLTTEWIAWLVERPIGSGVQAVVPRTGGGLEPLAALYHRECYGSVAAALGRGVRKITDALENIRIETVDEQEWLHLDPERRVLRNMNFPEDYSMALKWYEECETKPSSSVIPKPKG